MVLPLITQPTSLEDYLHLVPAHVRGSLFLRLRLLLLSLLLLQLLQPRMTLSLVGAPETLLWMWTPLLRRGDPGLVIVLLGSDLLVHSGLCIPLDVPTVHVVASNGSVFMGSGDQQYFYF